MSAGKQAFKLTETARLMKAARLAGLTISCVTTGRDGRPVLITGAGSVSDDNGPSSNPWEESNED